MITIRFAVLCTAAAYILSGCKTPGSNLSTNELIASTEPCERQVEDAKTLSRPEQMLRAGEVLNLTTEKSLEPAAVAIAHSIDKGLSFEGGVQSLGGSIQGGDVLLPEGAKALTGELNVEPNALLAAAQKGVSGLGVALVLAKAAATQTDLTLKADLVTAAGHVAADAMTSCTSGCKTLASDFAAGIKSASASVANDPLVQASLASLPLAAKITADPGLKGFFADLKSDSAATAVARIGLADVIANSGRYSDAQIAEAAKQLGVNPTTFKGLSTTEIHKRIVAASPKIGSRAKASEATTRRREMLRLLTTKTTTAL